MLFRGRLDYARLSILLIVIAWCGGNAAFAAPAPAPWLAQDIGAPSPTGSTSFASNVFTVMASGKDIWGTSDQFHFVYQSLTGDGEIVARVDSLLATDPWAKAGVMIRGSLSANAANAGAFLTSANGLSFQRRLAAGADTTSTVKGSSVTPVWVRLVRNGTQVTGYSSSNGTTWTTMSSDTVTLGATAYVGLAVTSHVQGVAATAALSSAAVVTRAATPLPSSQQAIDIGGPAIAGSTTYQSGTYTIKAGGTDIWSTADQFHYVYQAVTGDVEIVARVTGIGNADAWSKGGVMIRESLAAGSRNAMALASAGSGYSFQRRIDTGGFSTSSVVAAGAPPVWLRLVRTGFRLEAFRSTNGTTWTSMGFDTVPMADAIFVGLAATSHNPSAGTTVVVDNVTITAVSDTGNKAPIVALITPASGSSFAAPATLSMTATASDPENRLSRVEFYSGTTRIGAVSAAPFSMSWPSVPAGTYSLTAMAFDQDGGTATSSAATITVQSASNQLPTVALTAPVAGASITAPATVTISASATDPEGRMGRVEFYAGTTLIGTDTTAPYSVSWPANAAGSYALKAIAYDADGGSASSAVVNVTVITASALPVPQTAADIGAPAVAGSTTYQGGTYTIKAGGTDIWNTSDQFQFVYQPMDGDVEIVARVNSLVATDPWAKVGVMIRGSMSANSAYASAFVTSANGFSAQQRVAAGAITTSTLKASSVSPAWVRLVRSGTQVIAYSSSNGTTWTTIATATISLTTTAYVGVATTSHNATTATTAKVDSLTITATAGNAPPTIALTTPTIGSSFTAPATIALAAAASDPENRLARVEFYSGTTRIGSASTAPFSMTWPSLAAGNYSLSAMAFDQDGGTATSTAATITVTSAANQLPTVALTAPAAGASIIAPATVTVSASATDPESRMARVEFYVGTTLIGTDTTAPYSASWSASAAGTYAIKAIAFDADGGSRTSTIVNVTVSAVSVQPRMVMFGASPDHATLVTSYLLEVFANGANPQTATPIASSDMGKATPATNGDITVDRTTFFAALPVGTYVATISAIGPGGKGRSAPLTFSR